MHSWFAQSGSRPCPWSASRRATLERRSLKGRIYAGPPCRRNAVQYDPGSASIGDLLGRLRSYSKLREGRLRGHHTKREKSHANPSLQLSQVRFGIKREYCPGLLKVLVPPFSFQPLVENAIEHGLHSSPRAGRNQLRQHQQLLQLRHDPLSDSLRRRVDLDL